MTALEVTPPEPASAVGGPTTGATAPDGSAARTRRRRFPALRPSRHRPLGLRRRILLIFTLGALGLSTFLAFTTYGLVRSNLASQRDSASINAAYQHAAQVLNQLTINSQENLSSVILRLGVAEGDRPLLMTDGNWSTGDGRVRQGLDTRRRAFAGDRRRRAHPQDRRHRRCRRRWWWGSRWRGSTGPTSRRSVSSRTTARCPTSRCRCCCRRPSRPGSASSPACSRRGVPCDRWRTPPRPPRRSPAGTSTPGWRRPTIPTSACLPPRSTTWRRRCSCASSGTPASPPT